jgi:hypothetical protein
MNRDLAEIDHRSRTYSLTNGRIMADFVLGRQGITRDEVEVWTRDLEERGQEGDISSVSTDTSSSRIDPEPQRHVGVCCP